MLSCCGPKIAGVIVCVDHPYDIFALEAFGRSGQRPYSSPAQEVLADFTARGITVDQLYSMLAEMEAWGCLDILEEHGGCGLVLLLGGVGGKNPYCVQSL